MANYTLAQLATLRAAIASGTTRVRYDKKEVEYRSLAEMIELETLISGDLDGRRTRSVFAPLEIVSGPRREEF